jgi:hypothetical protein
MNKDQIKEATRESWYVDAAARRINGPTVRRRGRMSRFIPITRIAKYSAQSGWLWRRSDDPRTDEM